MQIKEIKVFAQGNEFFAEIKGLFGNPSYKVVDIQRNYNKYCIEIVLTAESMNPDGMNAMVMSGFKQVVNLGQLPSGKYCVRINHNNDWVEWFTT